MLVRNASFPWKKINLLNRDIAKARIHVERAIQRLKKKKSKYYGIISLTV